jgi:hypothetical protein
MNRRVTARQPTRPTLEVVKRVEDSLLRTERTRWWKQVAALSNTNASRTRMTRNRTFVAASDFVSLGVKENVWGLYKPPFAPMRAAHAQQANAEENFHNVSVEEYVGQCAPRREHELRVLYELNAEASGVVCVGLGESMQRLFCTQTYVVLVHGKMALGAVSAPSSHIEALKTGWYGPYEASLVRITMVDTPANSIDVVAQLKKELQQHPVIGYGFREDTQQVPRAMVHLERTVFRSEPTTVGAHPSTDSLVSYFCAPMAFRRLLSPHGNATLHSSRITVVDGFWKPSHAIGFDFCGPNSADPQK